jgi:hypothetical protein
MAEDHYRWEDFKINFGADIFQRVDFDPPQLRPDPIEVEQRPPSSFPNFDIPGIRTPEPGFNWQTYQLARNNFPLFLRILQRVVKEVTYRSASKLGETVDPRRIDFRRFVNGMYIIKWDSLFDLGFNLTDYDPNVVYELKKYVLNRYVFVS